MNESTLTPEVNFVSVNSNGEEADRLEQHGGNGLGTLGKVWSMNQVLTICFHVLLFQIYYSKFATTG